jgi:hypothetical protein
MTTIITTLFKPARAVGPGPSIKADQKGRRHLTVSVTVPVEFPAVVENPLPFSVLLGEDPAVFT